MRVKFTKHALERMIDRSISRKEVFATLNDPDRITTDSYGNTIAQKVIDRFLVRVIYKPEKEVIRVITVYRTSKINKYSR